MPTIVVRHKVRDIDTWLKGHQERVELFAPAVQVFKHIRTLTNSVVLIVDVTDMEKLGAIMNDSKNQAIKDRHTVLEPIIMSTQVDI
jgi:nitrogen regulatory protein PII-like uncharacterized protein